jgi:hypothetical protein
MTEQIQLAINEIQTAVSGVSGILKAPQNPPGNIGNLWSVAYPSSGVVTKVSYGFSKSLHDITLVIVSDITDMERAYAKLTPYVDLIPKKLFDTLDVGTFVTIKTFGDITYSTGQIDWGGTLYWSVQFIIKEVKTLA